VLQEREVSQPRFPENISALPEQALKDLYDRYLHYYDFLTDQLIFQEMSLGISLQNMKYVEAGEVLRVARETEKRKTTQDVRDARVKDADCVQEAIRYHARVSGFVNAVSEKRAVISKIMERLYRELLMRGEVMGAYGRANALQQQQAMTERARQMPAQGAPKRPWDKR
jgi:hypothetical protein